MSKQVPWTKATTEFFIEQCMLTKEEQDVLKTRIAGHSRTQQAMELHMSISKVDRYISTLKKKYDYLQKRYPDILPVRTTSAEEVWMDTH